MHHAIIFFSLIVTIFSALDPNEQIAICKLNGINTVINCTDPCNSLQNKVVCLNEENILEINFYNLNINGSIPTEYGYFTRLSKMYLDNNELTGTIPTQLGNLTNLQVLYLNGNNLLGLIPKDIGNLTKLNELNLSYNNLSGPIPKELGNITTLSYLNLDINNISGSIPQELGDLINLIVLNLNSNALSGLIPSELGKLTTLNQLYLNNNNLTDSIPKEFGNLTSLQSLYLNNNNLIGTIPTQLGLLTNINIINLSYNQLTGTIPTQILNFVNNGQILYSNNPLGLNSPQPNDLNPQPSYPNPQPDDLNNPKNSPQPNDLNPQPSYPNPQPNNSNNSLEVNQTLNLSDGNFVYQTVNVPSGSLLSTNNVDLTATTIILSENSILSITNSSIHVQENITIPTGFILSITNPKTTSLETSGCMNIQPNTTINISLPSNYGDTQTNNLALISFKCKTGTFSKININNECIELVENKISFVLTQSSERKCTSSSQETTITICAIVTIFFVSLLF